METLDLTKPREAYRFLFGEDLAPSQEDHIVKLCAIYQIRPDNVDILREVINSGYIRESEQILGKMADLMSEFGESVRAFSQLADHIESVGKEVKGDLKRGGEAFGQTITAQSVKASQAFWESISRQVGEYEKITLDQVTARIDATVAKSLAAAETRLVARAESKVRAVAIAITVSSFVTAGVMFLALHR